MQGEDGLPTAASRGRSGAHGEQVLTGGTSNRGLVVRVGATVRRPQSAASRSVHSLLDHLDARGFDGAPRYLGEDEHGREVLSFVEGDVPTAPYPDWALTDEALTSAADLLRRYHRAVEGFDPAGRHWGSEVPAGYRGRLLGHNDPAPDNIVFRDGRAVALIDFDLASPGSAVWDLALLARLWVPLRDPADVPAVLVGRVQDRLRLVVDAYDPPAQDRRRLLAAAGASHAWCYDIVRAGAERGQPGYARYWTPQAQERDRRGRAWFDAGAAGLSQVLQPDG